MLYSRWIFPRYELQHFALHVCHRLATQLFFEENKFTFRELNFFLKRVLPRILPSKIGLKKGYVDSG